MEVVVHRGEAGVMTDTVHRGCRAACRASDTQGRGLGWK